MYVRCNGGINIGGNGRVQSSHCHGGRARLDDAMTKCDGMGTFIWRAFLKILNKKMIYDTYCCVNCVVRWGNLSNGRVGFFYQVVANKVAPYQIAWE